MTRIVSYIPETLPRMTKIVSYIPETLPRMAAERSAELKAMYEEPNLKIDTGYIPE